jgi:hypothetical protein
MMVLSYLIGQKYFPVKYNLVKFSGYLGLSLALYMVSTFVHFQALIASFAFHTAILLVFLAVVYLAEKPRLSFRS